MPILPITQSTTQSGPPIYTPIPTGTLQDIFQDVTDALQGRTDVTTTQVAYYGRKAIIELSEKYQFEELRTTGPNVTLTIGQSQYPFSFFLNQGDDYNYLEALVIYVDFPTNSVTNTLDYKTPKAIEQMISPATQGLPSRWTRFGQNIHIGPTPAQMYTMFSRYQVKHSFSSPAAITDSIYMPLSWYDIIAYATAERIALIKRWTDQAKTLHDILWGDPEFQTSKGLRGRPGLVAARTLQPERDQRYNSRQITPLVSRYNPK